MSESIIGRVIAERYRIVRELGEGGMGSVYEAEHLALGRRVALKVLLDEHASSADFRARFEREAKVLSSLSHPNIVTVTDYGFDGDTPFLVMDLLQGRELTELLAEGLEPVRAGQIARQLLLALAHAHASGLVHRDLKPANVFVQRLGDGSDHVTVLDFGLARQVEGGTTVTKTGLVLGTPAYMAPEQAAGETADARSDVYALGVLIFEMLAGRRPFPQTHAPELMRAHLLTPPPPLSAFARVDPQIESLVARALAKSRTERFADAGEMLASFDVGRVSDPQLAPAPAATKPAKKMGAAIQDSERYGRDAEAEAAFGKTASGMAPVRSRSRLGLGLALGVVLGAVALLAILWPRDEPPPTAAPPSVEPSATSTPSQPSQPRVARRAEEHTPTDQPLGQPAPPADRWADPGDLAPFLERARRDRTFNRLQERQLAVMARRAEDDPRPLILLAHNYASKRNLTDAFERYGDAFQRDPSIVDDPWVRHDLITIAAAESLNRAAGALIARHFDAAYAEEIETRAAEEREPWRGRLMRVAAQLRR